MTDKQNKAQKAKSKRAESSLSSGRTLQSRSLQISASQLSATQTYPRAITEESQAHTLTQTEQSEDPNDYASQKSGISESVDANRVEEARDFVLSHLQYPRFLRLMKRITKSVSKVDLGATGKL